MRQLFQNLSRGDKSLLLLVIILAVMIPTLLITHKLKTKPLIVQNQSTNSGNATDDDTSNLADSNSTGSSVADQQVLGENSDSSATTAATLTPSSCHLKGDLPDPVCTPGSLNPAVTQDNLQQTICKAGFSKSIRPSSTYTSKIKRQQIAAYGFNDPIPAHYEEDHFISLELGGSPADPKNLWPEPGASPNAKDTVENRLHELVCAHALSLSDAQKRIATDWTTALVGY